MNYLQVGLLLALLGGCNSQETTGPATSPAQMPSAEQGWDIYNGGVYRYGPSIIVNDDGSIDAWFAAEGDRYGERRALFEKEDAHEPIRLTGDDKAAQRFVMDRPFYGLSVICPTWHSASSNLTLSLYQWNTDYGTTVAAAPVAVKDYIAFEDNAELLITMGEHIPAGEYLWMLSNPKDTPGVWKRSQAVTGVTSYLNGVVTEGSFEAWCLLEESGGGLYWDQAAYRRSVDGGKTWTPDQMVLKPTEGTRDHFSICDPGVVKYGDYYYIGYTSTEDPGMVYNHLYMCRGTSPTGPWEKWDGAGWGGSPEPIVTFNGTPTAWGVGEPSMVIVDGTLFLYYSWNDTGDESTTTRVATAPIDREDWPAHLTQHGTAINKSSIHAADHCDVKYRKDLGRFQAIHTASRISAQSHILLWESEDGITFKKVGALPGSLKPYLHNSGWSGDAQGHIDPATPQFIAYAYGPDWGAWKTAWHPLKF